MHGRLKSFCADVDGNDEIKRDKMALQGELKIYYVNNDCLLITNIRYPMELESII